MPFDVLMLTHQLVSKAAAGPAAKSHEGKMEVSLKVTDAPEESCFADLVAGDNVLSIPLFQRPYRWTNKHLQPLLEDIESIRDETASSVFLGVIVSYSRGTGPGRPVTWEVVDGQQRITTLYLALMAAVEVAARRGHPDFALDVIGTYLLVRPLSNNPVNTKLVPSYADRAQFASLWARLADIEGIKDNQTFKFNRPMPPSPTGAPDGEMISQYGRFRRVLGQIFDDGEVGALQHYVEIVARTLSFVSISLRDPAVAPKIFERLNARAEPVTIADLVRNEIFSRSGNDPIQAQHVFTTYWEPFVSQFKDSKTDLAKFLFPYGLIQNPNVRKADLFPQLRARWANFENPQDIINDLDRYRPTFLTLEAGGAGDGVSTAVNQALLRINRVGKPSSVYAFIMRLVDAHNHQEISEQDVIDILSQIESFLFRRAIAGIEPTGLHAVFKGLWGDAVSAGVPITGTLIKNLISSKPTISWPTDEQFIHAIATQKLYFRKVAALALREHELSLVGETPDEVFMIEHVAPQTANEHWKGVLGDDYDALVHTWGNLVPLSDKMNPSVGQKPFAEKKLSFSDSKFAHAREISHLDGEWDALRIRQRNKSIATWALSRWPY